ncbi:MAG: hypothetical protein VX720_05070 [Pseudomonadota bacterium]|nr:hypothetical protein [Pseudomonadota bacterium]
MKIRIITSSAYLVLFIIFLSWYDGWGIDPYTPKEINNLAKKIEKEGSKEQLKNLRLLLENDDGKEFFMLNLNRYEYAENEIEKGTPKSYQEYGMPVLRMMLSRASHPIFSAEIPNYLIDGDAANSDWDEVIIVRYRSRKDFFSMVTSDEYLEVFNNRAGGMEYAEVSATTAGINFTSPRFIFFMIIICFAFLSDLFIKRVFKIK